MSAVPEVELRVTMPDGSVWAIPAHVIANNRARYYAYLYNDNHAEVYGYTLDDDTELRDWAHARMFWDEVVEYARKVKPPQSTPRRDYRSEWLNANLEVVRPDAGRV